MNREITPKEKALYDRLYRLEINELELLKEISDKVIFDKLMNNLMEE